MEDANDNATGGILQAETPRLTPKKTKGIIIAAAILIVVLLAGNAGELLYIRNQKKEYEALDKQYASEYLVLNSIILSRFYGMVDSGQDFIVNISRPNCGTCRGFSEEYLEIVAHTGMEDDIYYLNVAELRKDNDKWAEFKEIFEIQGTPSFVRIKDGKVQSSTGWTPDGGLNGEDIERWLLEQKETLAPAY